MELIRMQQLAVVIHADNPNELMEKIDSILDGEDIDNDIGDLDKLKRFKEKNTYRK